MYRPVLKSTLIALGLFALAGTAGAESFHGLRVADRSGSADKPPSAEQSQPGAGSGSPTWDPWAEMSRFREEMDRSFERMDRAFEDSLQRMQNRGAAMPSSEAAAPIPDTTLKEENNDYVVTAQLPGIESGNVNVSLDGRLLRISAQNRARHEEKEDHGQVVQQSEYASDIQRAFTLPGPVDASKMTTHFDNGVLTVTVPKAAS